MKKDLCFLKENLIAHRGYHYKNIPENSIDAFNEAIKKKYIIELDIHLTKDNKIVVCHDYNLKRIANVDKEIEKLNYDEIKELKLFKTNNKIPLLEEVLKIINGKVPVIIELKVKNLIRVGKLERELVKILDNYNGKFAVKSFNPLTVIWFKKHKDNYIRGLLVETKKAYNLMFIKFCEPDFLSSSYKLLKDKRIKKFKKNKPVLAWTIRNKKNYDKYIDKYDNLICENMEEYQWKS